MRNTKLVLLAGAAMSAVAVANDDVQQSNRAELATDAATRTSLLTNDYGMLRQGDPAVNVSGQLQVRYTANIRDTADGSTDESFTHGFSIRRAKIVVDADLNETWSVKLQGAFDRVGGTFILEDAYADWELDENWTVRGGQFKTPTLREELISSKRQQFADRSETNEVFNLGRTQGVMGRYAADQFRIDFMFGTGAGSANTDFNGANNADYAVSARGEYLIAGDWSQLRDFAGWQGQELAAMVGAAVHWQDGGNTGAGNTGSTADAELMQLTVDGQVEGNGWNAFAAFIYNSTKMAGGDRMNNFGLVVQGGVFVSESDELFGRYDGVFADSDLPNDDPFNTVSFGWNHYFIPESHASKFTVDLQWFLNETTGNDLVSANTGIGLLNSSEKNQIALRAQYQATF